MTAWDRYAAGSEIGHFSDFCATHLVQSVDEWDGKPLTLEPFQERMMGEALAYGEDGYPVWRSIVICLARKNGKTLLLAAYAVYRLLTSDGSPEVLLAASSDKQAGRLFDAAALFIRRSVALSELCRVREYLGEIVREDGAGRILRMSSDPARLHGYNPSLVVCDELAQWTTPTLRRAYAALTSGGGARSAPQVFTITTAGEAQQRHSSLLGRILDSAAAATDADREPGCEVARLWDAQMLVFNHEAPTCDPRDTAAMKLANPASWITEEYLARQAADPELSDADVLQLHGCVWAESDRTWLSPAAIGALVNTARHVEAGEQVVLAFDGSSYRDATALVGCTVEEQPHVWVEGLWERPDGAPEAWRVPRGDVEAALHHAMATYDVVELAPDPPGWHREIEEWEETYGEPPVVRFVTGKPQLMGPAADDFFQGAQDGDFTIDDSEALRRHLGNCVAKQRGAYLLPTKDNPGSPRKIDAAIGAIIAYHRARWHYAQGAASELMVAYA